MSRRAGSSGEGDEQRPPQRRKLTEGNFGAADVVLISSDGIEYPSHRAMLSAACETFSDMFDTASGDASDTELPRIPLLADSEAAEMILPLVYRKPVAALRSKTYKQLLKGIKLAHRLGMPMVVGSYLSSLALGSDYIAHIRYHKTDILAVFLERDVPNHAIELHLLACQFDLQNLEEACLPAAIRMHDILNPNEHIDAIGLKKAAEIHKTRMEQLMRNLPPPVTYHTLRRKQKRCRLHGILSEGVHWEMGFMVLHMHSLQVEAELGEAGSATEPLEFVLSRRAGIRNHFAFTKKRLEDTSGCSVKKYLRSVIAKMETRYEDMITGSTRIKQENVANEGEDDDEGNGSGGESD